jgi:predicted  nucleic acid-binding Zn-ribbon protein
MSDFELVFNDRKFLVPRKSIFEFLDHRRDLLDASSYTVLSPIPFAIFESFVGSLMHQTKLRVTNENAAALAVLADELGFHELRADCVPYLTDPLAPLAERIVRLEQQSSCSSPSRQFEEAISLHELELESLRSQVDSLASASEGNISDCQERLHDLTRHFDDLHQDLQVARDSLVERIQFGLQALAHHVWRSIPGFLQPLCDRVSITEGQIQAILDRQASEDTVSQLEGALQGILRRISTTEAFFQSIASRQQKLEDALEEFRRSTQSSLHDFTAQIAATGHRDQDLSLSHQKLGCELGALKASIEDLAGRASATTASLEAINSTQETVQRQIVILLATNQPATFSRDSPGLDGATFPESLCHGSNPVLSPAAPARPQLIPFECPMSTSESFEGIISYLTGKHGGNVHDNGVVIITSKSMFSGPVQKVADLSSATPFKSKSEAGQWLCWDFQQRQIRPTDYRLWTRGLKSWILEASLDGENWTEIDRRINNPDFAGPNKASFHVCHPDQARFIRLTQTGRNHKGDDSLFLFALEIFGTLFEPSDSQ